MKYSRAKRFTITLLSTFLVTGSTLVSANEAEIVSAEFRQQGDAWTVATTLRHADAGWDHYADKWRVIDGQGKVLGERVLLHPHEQEQPFTRSQSGIRISAETSIVYVEAHDKVHGWSRQRVRVDLRREKGERYVVIR